MLKVIEFPGPNYADVANKLRELADEMENRQARGENVSCVVVLGIPGDIRVIGRGPRTSRLEMTGWLDRARHLLNVEADLHDFQVEDGPDAA
jgi:hypothetical protein